MRRHLAAAAIAFAACSAPLVAEVQMGVDITTPGGPAGQPVTFTAVITNRGTSDLQDDGAVFTARPFGWPVVRATATSGAVRISDAESVTWNGGALCGTQGSCPRSVTISFDAVPPPSAQDLTSRRLRQPIGNTGSCSGGGSLSMR